MKSVGVAIALAGTVLIAGAFIWPGSKVKVVSLQIKANDLPELGVRIITSSDPSFDQRAEPFLKGQSQSVIGLLKPFSVIVENKTRLAIVGSCIKWEIVKTDGTTVSRPVCSVNPRALMDGNEVEKREGAAIPASSTRFISPLGLIGEGQHLDLGNAMFSFRGSQPEMEEISNALRQGNREEAFSKSSIGKTLREATSVTVSIDGIFFEDGTFVGDERSNFYDAVKANIDAQYDLANGVTIALKQGRTPEEIFRQVEQDAAAFERIVGAGTAVGSSRVQQTENRVPESVTQTYLQEYNFFKAVYAREFMSMRNALGAKEAIAQKLTLIDKPRKELRRK